MKTIGVKQAFEYVHGLSNVNLTTFAKDEIEVVCKSGERHPKNYYAFQYARRLIELVLSEIGTSSQVLLELITNQVKEWCIRHPSDISQYIFCGDQSNKSRTGGRHSHHEFRVGYPAVGGHQSHMRATLTTRRPSLNREWSQ